MVGPVQRQGSWCGSCWAFAAAGALDCNNAIRYNKTWKRALSVQEILDCATDAGHGCDGGHTDRALDYAWHKGGLCQEDDYPYTAGNWGVTGPCKATKCQHRWAQNDGVQHLRKKSTSALMQGLTIGCVAVSINTDDAFQHYSSGILTGECEDNTSHAVVAVGYGEENGVKYWKLKNSWGSWWYVCVVVTLV